MAHTVHRSHNDRKLLRPLDTIIIVSLIAALFALYALVPSLGAEGAYAVITLDGETAAQIPLSADGDYTYPEIPGMVFTVSGGSIAVTQSDCGDKTCVRTGKISHRGEALICVPNRVAVSIGGGESDVDVII